MTTAVAPSGLADDVALAEALALGPDVWDGLLTRSGAANPFMTWAWHRACVDAAPPEAAASSRAVLLRGGAGSVAAIFPYRLQSDAFWGLPVTTMGWAFGDLGCPDHLDIIASPESDLDALAGALESLPWVAVRLGSVAERASNVERWLEACKRRGWTIRRRRVGRCLYLDLPESWEAYLGGLSAHARHALRRKERKLRREHHVTLTEYGPDRLEEGLEHLRRLHALRWGGGGAFGDPVMARLHRCFAAALAEEGRLWLVTLDLEGRPAAAFYGFSHGDTVYHYQSGRDPRWERERVGTVLVGSMIRRAIESGYRHFDFLRGEETYKTEWTRTARAEYELVIFRNGWRGAALRALDRIELPLRDRGLRAVGDRVRQRLADARRLLDQREETVGQRRVEG